MHHRVDRERQAGGPDHARHGELLGVAAAVAADALGVGGLAVLDRDLDVVEAGVGERVDLRWSSSTAAVIRLVYWPSALAWRTSSGRSRRSVGSPPEKWVCSTPSACASSITRCQVAVSSSAAARSSASGLEQ